MPARFLMIAMDGADGVLIDRWSADGTLPNLAALRARGTARRLSAPRGITDDAVWASFQYSAGLGEHGRYHWLQRIDSGQMGMTYHNENDRECFWDALSNQGIRVGIFDVPKCRAPRPLNGIHLVDWLVHGRYFTKPKSYPESLAVEVVEKFGPAPPSRCDDEKARLSNQEVEEVITNLQTSVARKLAASLHYLESDTWDLFVIGFKEAHCASHLLWDLADSQHIDHDSSRAALLRDPVRTILKDIDAAVGKLIAAVGRDAAISVFSNTDMEPNATLDHLMPEIVNRLNRSVSGSLISRVFHHLATHFRSNKAVQPACELLPYNENCTALRVTPLWGQAPGHKRRKARMAEKIESLLRELTDADTGHPVIFGIDQPSSNLTGSRAAALPDLLIHCAAGIIPSAVVSPRLGRIEAERPHLRPGNHVSGGFLISAGHAIDNVNTLQDFGPMAARVLNSSILKSSQEVAHQGG
jgi:hypothetical protein